MKKKDKATALTPAQGAVRFEARPDGTMQIKFDFSHLPEPTLYYYADCLALRVDAENQMVILSVGRSDAEHKRFTDHVEIVMPADKLLGDFWKSARDIEATLDQILRNQDWLEFPHRIEPPTGPAQTFYANILFMAVGIGESSLDFYQLSPRQIHFAKSGLLNEIQVLPVLRVAMSTALSKRLLSEIAQHPASQAARQQQQNGVVHA
jgi:hypothetical protein